MFNTNSSRDYHAYQKKFIIMRNGMLYFKINA